MAITKSPELPSIRACRIGLYSGSYLKGLYRGSFAILSGLPQIMAPTNAVIKKYAFNYCGILDMVLFKVELHPFSKEALAFCPQLVKPSNQVVWFRV